MCNHTFYLFQQLTTSMIQNIFVVATLYERHPWIKLVESMYRDTIHARAKRILDLMKELHAFLWNLMLIRNLSQSSIKSTSCQKICRMTWRPQFNQTWNRILRTRWILVNLLLNWWPSLFSPILSYSKLFGFRAREQPMKTRKTPARSQLCLVEAFWASSSHARAMISAQIHLLLCNSKNFRVSHCCGTHKLLIYCCADGKLFHNSNFFLFVWFRKSWDQHRMSCLGEECWRFYQIQIICWIIYYSSVKLMRKFQYRNEKWEINLFW